MNAQSNTSPAPSADLDEIYRALKAGGGRERVDDGNVAELISMAQQRGDAQLEFLLREWRSPCGADPEMPELPGENPPPR